jgi:uncharacterized protein YjlB
MKIIKTQSKIIKTKIKEHRRFKKELLDLINRMPNKSHQWITKSDWSLPQNFSRPYLDLFYKEVIPSSMQKMQNHFKAKRWFISRGWFQQYENNSYHQWHSHPRTNWANAYFLELPNSRFKTKIKIDNKVIDYDVKEGDLITFPAYLLHTSEKNKDGRKTVIAFNSDFIYD